VTRSGGVVLGVLTRDLVGRQEKRLALAISVLYTGTGMSTSLLALYLVHYLHLSAVAYGTGMSVAALLGIVSGPVVGWLADRGNGHRLYALLLWTMCLATAALTVVTAWLALVLLSVLTVCGRGGATMIAALVGRAVPEHRRVRYRALVKSLSNAMMTVGLGLGALVLTVDARWAFRLGFVAEAVTLLVAGGLVWSGAPAETPGPRGGVERAARPRRSRLGVLGDPRFVALTALNCLLSLPAMMLTIALPVWVSQRMHGPLWLVPAALVVQTIGLVLLQVPAARGVSDAASATRAGRRGAACYAIAAVGFPLAAVAHDGLVAAGVVIALTLALVGGDVLYSAGASGLVYGLVPRQSLGQYLGVFNTGFDVGMIVSPALFGWLAGANGTVGWFVLAGGFLIAAALLGPLGAPAHQGTTGEAT
jgi:MFS family permease